MRLVIMGFSNLAFLAVFLMAFTGLSSAVVYDVGDAAGWTKKGSVNYTAWAASKKFFVGDTIVFKYEKGEELLRVKHGDFKKCDTRNPMATFTSGNDSFPLKKPTHIYYISAVYGDCMAGQKVDIKVVSDAYSTPTPSPSPSPSPAVPVSPSLAPAPSPSSSPSLHAAGGPISICILAFLLFV